MTLDFQQPEFKKRKRKVARFLYMVGIGSQNYRRMFVSFNFFYLKKQIQFQVQPWKQSGNGTFTSHSYPNLAKSSHG
jgi:hypothetical protein